MIDNIKFTETFFRNVQYVKVETMKFVNEKVRQQIQVVGSPVPAHSPNPLIPQTPGPYSELLGTYCYY